MGFEQFGLEQGLLVVGHLHIPHIDHILNTLDRILGHTPPDHTHNFGHTLARIHILVARILHKIGQKEEFVEIDQEGGLFQNFALSLPFLQISLQFFPLLVRDQAHLVQAQTLKRSKDY